MNLYSGVINHSAFYLRILGKLILPIIISFFGLASAMEPVVVTNVVDQPVLPVLHWACEVGNREILAILPDDTNYDASYAGKKAIEVAVENGRIDIVSDLIKKGIKVDRPLIYSAAQAGHPLIVKLLVRENISLINENVDGSFPLHAAARGGHKDVVELLLAYGCNMNVVDSSGFTALHLAAINRHKEVIQALIERGAATDLIDNSGHYAWMHERERSFIVKALIEKGDDLARALPHYGFEWPFNAIKNKKAHLKMSICFGWEDTFNNLIAESEYRAICLENLVEYLLFAGEKENRFIIRKLLSLLSLNAGIRSSGDKTLLHVAVEKGRKILVEELLMHGADRSALDGDGKTALDRACERKNILDSSIASSVASEQRHVLDESVAREVTWESLIKERDSFKKIEAALKDPWEIVKSGDKRQIQYLFVVSPQFAAMVDQNGWSGLHYAVRSNPNEEAILTLIRYSPSVEGLTSHKNTLLHLAAANRHLRVLKELTRKMLEEFEINKGILVEPGLFPDGTPLAIILNRENSKKWTPLHNAARSSSNLEVIAFLLVNGANILARTIHGLTVMHLAACNETVDIIRFLLEKETDINVCDNAKLTPLHHAVKTNPQVAVVGILLDKGANVNAQDVNGETPLHLAVRKRDKNMVELLCVRGAKLTLQNKSGMTPLDIAAADGLREIVEVFAHKGSCQSDLEDNFYKALCLAAKAKHKEVIQVLIRCGAPILHKTSRVDTEWGFPCCSSSLDVKLSALGDMEKNSALIQAYDWNMLHIVVMSGRREVVKWFVENRKDLVDKCINCGDKNGWTPVHLAVIFGYQEILELLLAENNIQVKKQRDNFSMTPSHWAAIRSIKDELLTSLNRIFLPRNFIQGWFRSDDIKDENTRLHLLILFGNLREISRAITNEPAICNKINKANIDGATPLICAIYRGEKHLIELLIKHGADVNQEVTMKGKTFYPLHFVAELDRSDLIAFLLRDGRGTDRFARATYGTTALHWAAANGKSGAIDQLILGDEGQKLKYMEDGGKRIALHYAAMNGHLDAVKALVTSKNADIHGVSVSEEEFFVSASEEEFSMNVTLNDPCKTVDKQDAEGRTPLHWAVINGHEQVENFLLNCEPDRKVKDNTGKMAEEYRK